MESESPRDRVREAALQEFAALGFKGATVRGIASRAGVSPGLVQHHFPSKQALREECDRHAFEFFRTANERVIAGGFGPTGDEAAGEIALLGPYVAMALLSDAPVAAKWFDEVAETYSELLTSGELGRTLTDDEDVPAIVAVHTAMELGLAIFGQHVYRRLNADLSDPATMARLGRAWLFLATERLVGKPLERRLRATFDESARAKTTKPRRKS